MSFVLKFDGKVCVRHGSAPQAPIPSSSAAVCRATPTAITQTSQDEPNNITVQKEYCNFCGDLIQEASVCVECGASMCHQYEMGSSGCVALSSLKSGTVFRCILCHHRSGGEEQRVNGPLPYEFIGYSSRRRAKLTWPMILLTLADSDASSFLPAAISLDLQHQYYVQLDNLFRQHIDVRQALPGGMPTAEACRFNRCSIRSGWPSNTFAVLQLPVEPKSGHLLTPEGSLTALKTVQRFFGAPLLASLAKASQECLEQGSPPADPQWYDDSKWTRGGWRGLFLVTGGAAVRFVEALEGLKSMVESSTFDFVMGFGAASPDPQLYRRVISRVVENIGVDKTQGIWDTVLCAVGHDVSLLRSTNVVFIYKDRGDALVSCRSIALHAPAIRPWGIEFTQCGTPGCQHSRHDLAFRYDPRRISMTCRKCGWKSAWLTERDVSPYVQRLNSKLPDVYWCEYPPPEELRRVFISATPLRQGGDQPMNVDP